MNATATLPPEVADYLERVRAALAGVPPEERDEMLADLEVSLLEGAQDSVDPPEARLGPPERFAQELRAAAGIEQTVTAPSKPDLRTRLATLAATPRANAALATARELAPAWWVLRGYVAACAIALFGNFGWSDQYDLIPSRGHAAGGALLVLAGIVLSVWLGLRSRRGQFRTRWLTALNLAVAIATLPIGLQSLQHDGTVTAYLEPAPASAGGILINGRHVTNLYPYSRDGKLLLDVLLYDDHGQPIEVGNPDPGSDPHRRYVYSKGGEPLLNTFPIRYTEPGTRRVEDPLAAPPELVVPKVKTPKLKVKQP